MITIKEFAKVCKCNTQTLRYYDRIDLLKPAKVDEITGYRHYNISQAVDYVKIKNLQLAEFSIDEIKKLLEMSDDDIYGAFDEKIAFHKDRLAKIMEIQKSYLKEKSAMEKLIDNITKLIFSNTDEFDYIGEFGLETEDNEKMQNMVRGFLRQNTVSSNDIMLKMGDTVFQGIDTVLEKLDAIKPENLPKNMQIGDKDAVSESKTVDVKSKKEIWKKSGWNFVREIIGEIPTPEAGAEYTYMFKVQPEKQKTIFGTAFLYALMLKKAKSKFKTNCLVEKSDDDQNHLIIYA